MTFDEQTIQVGLYGVNCTLIGAGDSVWVFDPGQEATRILELCRAKSWTPRAILLTHAHFDHIGGVKDLQGAIPDIPVYIGQNDVRVLTHPFNQLPPDYPPITEPFANLHPLSDGDEIPELGARVIATPGHTPGGVSYYLESNALLLAGDTLFAGSAGRTDLPGGNMRLLLDSLQRLTALPDATRVIPGHGPFTTIAAEKAGNPFLR